MVDPVAGAGQVGADMAANQSDSGRASESATNFDDLLEADMDVESGEAAGPNAEGGVDAVDAASEVEETRLSRVIDSIQSDRASLEATMDRVMGGQDLDQREMLEMQALVYQYSQRVELTSKVVEKATGGLKQMLNMQV